MAIGIANAAVAILGMSLAGAFADKRAAERIAHMAHHDPLTGLPNRAAFAAQFATVLDRSAAAGSGFAIVCIDLDRFKEVNDLFGHSAGDLVLREVSDRLLTAVQGEFVARLEQSRTAPQCAEPPAPSFRPLRPRRSSRPTVPNTGWPVEGSNASGTDQCRRLDASLCRDS